MTDEQQKINKVFENYLESYFSTEAKQQITQIYGEEILARVVTIYNAALNVSIDWRTATMDFALDTMQQFVTENYPWLNDKARTKINYAFIMAWK